MRSSAAARPARPAGDDAREASGIRRPAALSAPPGGRPAVSKSGVRLVSRACLLGFSRAGLQAPFDLSSCRPRHKSREPTLPPVAVDYAGQVEPVAEHLGLREL